MKRMLIRLSALTAALLLIVGCTPSQNSPGGTTTSEVSSTTTTSGSEAQTTTAVGATSSQVDATDSQADTTTTSATPVANDNGTTTKSSRRTVTTRPRTTQAFFDEGITYPITPTMSIEKSSLRIHNNVTPTRKLKSEFVRVTEFDPKWAFMHHTSGVAYFKGKLYTAFSRGYTGEDFPGQQMVISSSDDFYNWSDPTVIVPAAKGRYGETCIIPSGFYATEQYLVALYSEVDYDEKWFNADGSFNPKGAVVSRADCAESIPPTVLPGANRRLFPLFK